MPRLVERPLTDLSLRKAQVLSTRYDLFDSSVRGLGLRVSPAGTKSWFMMRRVNNRMVRATFGRYPETSLADAREYAPSIVKKMKDGEHLRKYQKLFEFVLEDWLLRDQASNKSVDQVKIAMHKHALPAFRGMNIKAIRKRDIINLIDKISDDGTPIAAKRILTFLKRFFNWAVERDILEVSPAVSIKSSIKEQSRDRVLTIEELKSILLATRELKYPWGYMAELLILTGCRLKEVAEASWGEFNIEEQIWNLPAARTKNGLSHQIQLSQEVIDILLCLPKIKSQSLLFSTNGRSPVSGFSKAKKRIDGLAKVADWTFHDLRRSFATHVTERLKIAPAIVDKILNHKSGAVQGVSAVYQRSEYGHERREVLKKWGNFIGSLNEHK